MQLLSLLLVSLTLAVSSSASHGKGKHRISTSSAPAAPTTTISASTTTTNPPAANTSVPTSTTAGNPSCPPYVGPTPTAVSKSGKATSSIIHNVWLTICDHQGSAAFIADALAQHNAARAMYGAPPVTWNTDLYPSTQTQVDGCVFAHRYELIHGRDLPGC